MFLYLIRHAETANNADKRFVGREDPPCTETGLHEAATYAGLMKAHGIGTVYVSPQLRARQTAETLFPDLAPVVDSRLQERDLGAWSGQRHRDVGRDYPWAVLPNGTLDARFQPPGGESYPDLIERLVGLLNQTADDHGPSERVAFVTHNGVARVTLAVLGLVRPDDVFAQAQPHLEPGEPIYVEASVSLSATLDRLLAEEACCDERR